MDRLDTRAGFTSGTEQQGPSACQNKEEKLDSGHVETPTLSGAACCCGCEHVENKKEARWCIGNLWDFDKGD